MRHPDAIAGLTPKGSQKLAGGRAPARPAVCEAQGDRPRRGRRTPVSATPPGSDVYCGDRPVVERALDHRLISATPLGNAVNDFLPQIAGFGGFFERRNSAEISAL